MTFLLILALWIICGWLAYGLVFALFVDDSSRRKEAEARAEALEGAMRAACNLLAERIYGNAARSPGHNARVVLESTLAVKGVGRG